MRVGTPQNLTPHQPFPIADYTEGLTLNKEPWITPRNAWRSLEDARIFRGRLEKRRGYRRLAEVGIEETTPAAFHDFVSPAGEDPITVYEATPTTRRIVAESCEFTHLNGADPSITAEVQKVAPTWVTFTETTPATGFGSGGAWRWPIVETSSTDVIGYFYYRPGGSPLCQAHIRWAQHSGFTMVTEAATGSTFTYWYNEQEPIMGLAEFRDANGEYSIAIDTNWLYLYDGTDKFYKQESFTAGPFTGDGEDYFWTWPLDTYLVLTNGVDPVMKWTPGGSPAVSEMPTNFDGSPGNDIDTALLVVRLGGRLVYLYTTEGGSIYPTRARWTTAGSFETFDDSLDFADAPAELGDIVTAQFIGERCFVGFEKGWMELVSTGDASSPIEWRPMIARFGAVSKLSTIKDNERLLSRSETTMQAIDPNGQYYIDTAIPDYVLNFSQTKTHLCAATRNEERRAFWWSIASVGATTPNGILSAQYDEKGNLSWSIYNMPFTVFARFENESTPTVDSMPGTPDDYEGVSVDSVRIGEGFPQTIGGGQYGTIHVFDNSNTDWGSNISFSARTANLAPFSGQRTHLGWVDIYATASTGAVLAVEFFEDDKNASYKAVAIDLTPAAASSKVWRRIRVNKTATFHRIGLAASGSTWFAIDAVVPWFRPAGRIREFG